MKGKVKFFNEMKGFGFIAADDGKEYFVHQTALGPGMVLRENDDVVFDVEEGERGPKAVNVSMDSGEDSGSEESSADESDSEESSDDEESEDESEVQ